ncbi:MAG: hypothetical protein GVY07_10195 [Bacteroidetes bacterium]|jgi:photosystem II stability/assembly factor-like uncharacterized protein|nr:hypothetical protein [Bacteroidota bacterium]
MNHLKNRSNSHSQKYTTYIVFGGILACLVLSCSTDSSSSVSDEESHSLTIKVKGQGEVMESQLSSKATDFAEGSVVELMAVPAEQWEFIRWEGDIEGENNPTSISISNNSSVTAIFQHEYVKVEIEGEGDVDVEILNDNGKMKGAEGRAKLTATPEDGWQFVSWEGDLNGTENPLEIAFEDEINADAVFVSETAKWRAAERFTKRIDDFYFINETRGWATVGTGESSEATAIYSTADGGFNWGQQYSGKWRLVDIMFADENHGWATGVDFENSPLTGVILYTDDGGQNWEEQFVIEGSCACSIPSITVLNRDEVWVSGFDDEDFLEIENDGILLQTSNGGQTWQEVDIYEENQEDQVIFSPPVFSDSNTGWITGLPESFKTNDGGHSWNQTNQDYRLKDFVDSSLGWGIRGANANIYHTEDGGKSWLKISSIKDFVDFTNVYDMDFVTSQLGWVATDKGIIQTTDGGTSWQLQEISSSSNVNTSSPMLSSLSTARLGFQSLLQGLCFGMFRNKSN